MQRIVRWVAVIWALGVAIALTWLPLYSYGSITLDSNGTETRSAGRSTLASVNGAGVYLILAVPVLVAAIAVLPLPVRLRRAADIFAATIATAFVILGLMSIGAFFLPTALALLGVAFASQPDRPRAPRTTA